MNNHKKLSIYKKISIIIIFIGLIALINNFVNLVFVYHCSFKELMRNPSISILLSFILIILVSYFFENNFFKFIHILIFLISAILALFTQTNSKNVLGTEYIFSLISFILTFLLILKYGFLKKRAVIKTIIFVLIVLFSFFFKTNQLIGDLKKIIGISLIPLIFISFSLLIVVVLYSDEIKKYINKKKKLESLLCNNLEYINIGKNYSQLIHNIKNDLNVIYSANQILNLYCKKVKLEKVKTSLIKKHLTSQKNAVEKIIKKINANRAIVLSKKNFAVNIFSPAELIDSIIYSFLQLKDLVLDIEINFIKLEKKIYLKMIPAIFVQIVENIILNAIECFYRNDPKTIEEIDWKLIEEKNKDKICVSNYKNSDVLNNDYILKNRSKNKKLKYIILKEDIQNDFYVLEISNNGPEIEFCKNCKNKNKNKSCLECYYFNNEYTTKVEGTGTGMNFVVRMLKEFKGDLKVFSNKQKTTFKIYFRKYDK